MTIIVERIRRVGYMQWQFMAPVDPYWAMPADEIIWKEYRDFAKAQDVHSFVVELGLGPISANHNIATPLMRSYLGHRDCPWRHGFVHMALGTIRDHVNRNFPVIPHW